MEYKEYLEKSGRTLSGGFHNADNEVVQAYFNSTIQQYLDAIKKLDMLKKIIFYGKNIEIEAIISPNQPDYLKHLTKEQQNILHAAIGYAGESGEILKEVVESFQEKREFDVVNISEEIGDSEWYKAIFLRDFNLDNSNILAQNIAKLEKRYKDNIFKKEEALNRDLKTERKILEENQ